MKEKGSLESNATMSGFDADWPQSRSHPLASGAQREPPNLEQANEISGAPLPDAEADRKRGFLPQGFAPLELGTQLPWRARPSIYLHSGICSTVRGGAMQCCLKGVRTQRECSM